MFYKWLRHLECYTLVEFLNRFKSLDLISGTQSGGKLARRQESDSENEFHRGRDNAGPTGGYDRRGDGERRDKTVKRQIQEGSHRRRPARHCTGNEDRFAQVRKVQETQLYLQPNSDPIGRRADDDFRTLQRMRQSMEVLLNRLPIIIAP